MFIFVILGVEHSGLWECQYQCGIMPADLEEQQRDSLAIEEGTCWKLAGKECRELMGARSFKQL